MSTASPRDLSEKTENVKLDRAAQEAINIFLRSRKVENCSPATVTTYRDRLTRFFEFAGKSPAEVNKGDVEDWLLHLKQTPSRRGGTRSPAFVRSCFVSVRAFFNWMVGDNLLESSPVSGMKMPKIPKMGKPFLDEAQFQRLLDQCPSNFVGTRNRAWLWLLWSTGARFSELANLQLGDLNWDGARIRVMGKGSKERHVPFTKDAQRAVQKYLGRRQDGLPQLWITEERRPMAHAGLIAATQDLFARATDYRCEGCARVYDGAKFTYGKYVCPACQRPLVRLWTIQDLHHCFRRSFAYRNLRAGAPAKMVQLICGWESLAIMENYVRLMTAEDALNGSVRWV